MKLLKGLIFISILMIQSFVTLSQEVNWLDDKCYEVQNYGAVNRGSFFFLKQKDTERYYVFDESGLDEISSISNLHIDDHAYIAETGENRITVFEFQGLFRDSFSFNTAFKNIKSVYDLDYENRILYYSRNDSTFSVNPYDESENFIIDRRLILVERNGLLSLHDSHSENRSKYSIPRKKLFEYDDDKLSITTFNHYFLINRNYDSHGINLLNFDGLKIVSDEEMFEDYEISEEFVVLKNNQKLKVFHEDRLVKIPDEIIGFEKISNYWKAELSNGKYYLMKNPLQKVLDDEFDIIEFNDPFKTEYLKLKNGQNWVILNPDLDTIFQVDSEDVDLITEKLFTVEFSSKMVVMSNQNEILIDDLKKSQIVELSQFFHDKFLHVYFPNPSLSPYFKYGKNNIFDLDGNELAEWMWYKGDKVYMTSDRFRMNAKVFKTINKEILSKYQIEDVWMFKNDDDKLYRLEDSSGTPLTDWIKTMRISIIPNVYLASYRNGLNVLTVAR